MKEINFYPVKKIAVYARYSTDMQSPTSIIDQQRECLLRLKALGLDESKVVHFTDEGLSAAKADVNRPGFESMMEQVRLGEINVIVTHELSRLTRRPSVNGELIERCDSGTLRIIAIIGNIDTANGGGQLPMMFYGLVNKLEIDSTRARVKRNHAGLMDRHCVMGRPPFGYRIERKDPNVRHLGATFVQIPEEAAIIQRLYNLRYKGWSYGEIAETLNKEFAAYFCRPDTRPEKGYWTIGDIAQIISKPIYRGMYSQCNSQQYHIKKRKALPLAMKHDYRPADDFPRFHEEAFRMVSDTVWHACQPKRHGSRDESQSGGYRHWCSALLSCPHCGKRMAARPRAKTKGHQGCVVYCAQCQNARRFAGQDIQPIAITSPALWSLCRYVLADVAKMKLPQIQTYLCQLKPEDAKVLLGKRKAEAAQIEDKLRKARARFTLMENSSVSAEQEEAEFQAIVGPMARRKAELEAEIRTLNAQTLDENASREATQKQLSAMAGIDMLLDLAEPQGKMGRHIRTILRETFPSIRVQPRPKQRCHEITLEFDVALGQLLASRSHTTPMFTEISTHRYTLVTSSRSGQIRILNEREAQGCTGDIPEGYRRCADCEQTKPLDAFRYNPESDRLRSYCKPCFMERNRLYQQNRTQKRRALNTKPPRQ